MSPTSRLIALDIEEEFANGCRVICDDRLTVYHACATDLSLLLKQAGVPPVDYIVSSIPLSIVDDNVADEILRVAESSLRPGGRFLQYQYSLGYLGRLTARFSKVRVGFTLRNIPPAVVYECETRRGDGEGVMETIGSTVHKHSVTR